MADEVHGIRDAAIPLCRDDQEIFVWGYPLTFSWWNCALRDPRTNNYSEKGRFAAEVAIALEQMRRWHEGGVQINGRNWGDIGGGQGYYSVALKLLGAGRVQLVDLVPPPWTARSILEVLGVEIVEGDGNTLKLPVIDSAVCLYVPSLSIFNVVKNCPLVTELVVDPDVDSDMCSPRLDEQLKWSRRQVPYKSMLKATDDLAGDVVNVLSGTRCGDLPVTW